MISINIDPTTLACVLAAASAAYAYFCFILLPRLEQRKPFANLPMALGNHWFMGHFRLAYGDFKETDQLMLDSADENGRTGFWIASQPSVALTRWEDAQAILRAESNVNRVTNPIVKKHAKMTFGLKNILVVNGKEWKIHRAALNKSFTPDALNAYKSAMIQVTETAAASLKSRIAEQGPYQCTIEPLMKMIALDIFGLTALSHDFGSTKTLQSLPIAVAFDALANNIPDRVQAGLLIPSTFFYSIPTERNRKSMAVKKEVDDFVSGVIDQRKAEGTAALKQKDLLSLLLAAGEGDTEALHDSLLAVLFAGYDTTSITLTYAVYLLSQYPEAQAKCLEEINRVSSLEDVDDLVYCRAVIQETLRLFPSAPQTMRSLTKPVKLHDGFVVPAGTGVTLPIWHIQRSEMNFARPSEFLPERWVKRESIESALWTQREILDTSSPIPAANPKAFFAFSGGGRNCAGQKFAWQESVIVLAGLLKEVRFEAMPDYKLQPKRTQAIQHPHDGLPMTMYAR